MGYETCSRSQAWEMRLSLIPTQQAWAPAERRSPAGITVPRPRPHGHSPEQRASRCLSASPRVLSAPQREQRKRQRPAPVLGQDSNPGLFLILRPRRAGYRGGLCCHGWGQCCPVQSSAPPPKPPLRSIPHGSPWPHWAPPK